MDAKPAGASERPDCRSGRTHAQLDESWIERLDNHPKDWQVLAAAIVGRAECLVTFNLRDFPAAALTPYAIEAIHPDQFALTLFLSNPNDMVATLRRHRAQLTRPAKSVREYLDALERCGLSETVKRLEGHVNEL